ncbi:MAG: cyclic pyranopterin monophosphate synthase MoaC [Holdemanella sp.]|nr:cyclic pyranopterin monophosphate synthase MoaC [Holdemanella sp.]
MELNHFDDKGNAWMVDVSDKDTTERTAIATGKIYINKEIMDAIIYHSIKKGDVLGVARIAGIMAAKKTSELIPLCHLLPLTKCQIDFEIKEDYIEAYCMVKTVGKTGVEMEALTGVQIALLTIYDMCKAIDKSMVISDVHLLNKSGGKSGDFVWKV